MHRIALFSIVLVLLLVTASDAQEKVIQTTATVYGHVYSGDNNSPLRMADVFLIPSEQIDNCLQDSGKGYQLVSSVLAGKTLLDGSFTVPSVQPGIYFVVAVQNGYINALEQLRMHAPEDLSNQEKRAKLLRNLPTVTVENSQPLAVNVTVTHGGSITGTVTYDDGSPAYGIRLSVLYRFKDQWKEFPSDNEVFNPRSISDDNGHYRLNSLPPGEYIIKADLHLTNDAAKSWRNNGSISRDFDLSFYSGNKPWPAEAVGFQLSDGESRSGEDIEIPLTRLHSIHGHLTASNDGHLLNAGDVILLRADDRSPIAKTSLERDEIAFQFQMVPEGQYILRVEGAEDANYKESQSSASGWIKRGIKSYPPVEEAIQITGDQTDLVIAVPAENSGGTTQ